MALVASDAAGQIGKGTKYCTGNIELSGSIMDWCGHIMANRTGRILIIASVHHWRWLGVRRGGFFTTTASANKQCRTPNSFTTKTESQLCIVCVDRVDNDDLTIDTRHNGLPNEKTSIFWFTSSTYFHSLLTCMLRTCRVRVGLTTSTKKNKSVDFQRSKHANNEPEQPKKRGALFK